MANDTTVIIGTKLDTKGLSDGMKQVSDTVSTFNKAATGDTIALGKAIGMLVNPYTAVAGAAALVVVGFAKATFEVIKATESIAENSQKMGLSISSYQKMNFLAGQTGTTIDAVGIAIKSMTKATDTQQQAFADLGVSLTNAQGGMKSQEELFRETLTALSRMPEGTERAALAFKLLGKSAGEMMPAINGGEQALNKYFDSAENAVLVSDRLAQASDLYSDSLAIVQGNLAKMKNEALEPVIVTLSEFMLKLANGDIENSAFGVGINFIKMEVESFATVLDFTLGKLGLLYRSSADIAREIENIEKGLGKSGKKTDALSSMLFKNELPKLREELSKSLAYEKKIAEQAAKTKEESEKRKTSTVVKAVVKEKTTKEKSAQELADIESKYFSESIKRVEAYHKTINDTKLLLAESASVVSMPSLSLGGNKSKLQTSKYGAPLETQSTDGGEWAIAEAEKKQQAEKDLKDAKMTAAFDIAETTIAIGKMIADAAVTNDQRELDSWKRKESEKISGLNVSSRRKAQLEKQMNDEALRRESELNKKRARIQIAGVWATVAASSAETFANAIAHGAKLGAFGMSAAGVAAGVAIGTMNASAIAQTAIIASQMNGYADGGAVGGRNTRSTTGADDTVGTLRTGERVLNAQQQARLDNVLFGGGGASGGVTINIGELTGDKLQELEEMLLKLRSYGRI